MRQVATELDERFSEPGEGVLEYPGGESLVFGVTPSKVLVFGRGKFSHNRHVVL